MAIDITHAEELRFAPLTVDVERGRLRFFGKAIGETDPVYLDAAAACAAGHPDIPVPPTFFFSLSLEAPQPFGYLDELGVDLRRVLHGEQSFEYHALAYAGDRLTLQDRIVDVYAKRGGALEFVVKQTEITRAGAPVADLRSVLVVRNPEVTT
ncbi:MaoC family dehydratase N-terminal domain-containing protein [Streptomyces sp. Tu102]|uniref:MaoC family dehydratase N-terminal domain-containing protein n=1 Tax=Streptomyces TaxID=1883 RepID=UPI001BDD2898|nr:MaoC family dehydratase N-terminal domain-containing protein [Streptomyces sp. Tu102]MBT1098050.1 MaoC family dehydratase N-terminal domain-containing protein [Streptomyces sp. Tu102]